MWATERDFSRYILQRLKGTLCQTYRIETGSTAVGIPDAYVLLPSGGDLFIEFKNNNKYKITSDHYKVLWRPAQKVFATQYHMYRAEIVSMGDYSVLIKKYVLTLMGVDGGFLIIRMNMDNCNKNSNEVLCSDCDVYRYTMKELKKIELKYLLRMIAEFPVVDIFYPGETVLSYCYKIVNYCCWREHIVTMTEVDKEKLIEEAIEEEAIEKAQLFYESHFMKSGVDIKDAVLAFKDMPLAFKDMPLTNNEDDTDIETEDGCFNTETKYSYLYNVTSAIMNKFIKIKLFS